MKEKGRKREEQKKERKETERRIIRILSDEKLSGIKALLEKDHAIDCMFLLLLNKGRWREAKEFMRKNGKQVADATYRARMIEIAMLKLATRNNIGKNPNQYRYSTTDFGRKTAELLLEFFDRIS